MSKWKCCKKEPSETGKKVLCQQKGDLYVAMRLYEYYIPMPFADHYFSSNLCYPETWCEIDFPERLTGLMRVLEPGKTDLITLAEFEKANPEEFKKFADALIDSLGTLEKPSKMKRKN
jgi:hypothetical protein